MQEPKFRSPALFLCVDGRWSARKLAMPVLPVSEDQRLPLLDQKVRKDVKKAAVLCLESTVTAIFPAIFVRANEG